MLFKYKLVQRYINDTWVWDRVEINNKLCAQKITGIDYLQPPAKVDNISKIPFIQCGYCGLVYDSSFISRDHVIPRKFGTWLKGNCIICCIKCNYLKMDLTIFEFPNYIKGFIKPKNKYNEDYLQRLYKRTFDLAYSFDCPDSIKNRFECPQLLKKGTIERLFGDHPSKREYFKYRHCLECFSLNVLTFDKSRRVLKCPHK